jgi:hypothetical protein
MFSAAPDIGKKNAIRKLHQGDGPHGSDQWQADCKDMTVTVGTAFVVV